MTDLTLLTERDILVRLDGKFDAMESRVAKLETQMDVLRTALTLSDGTRQGRAGMAEMLSRAPSVVWTLLATGAIVYAWLH